MASIQTILFVILQCFIVCTVLINGERTKDKMYEKIEGAAACFRRLNATHQVGCSSQRNGDTGVVHVAVETEDIEWLVKNGTASPYMVVLQPDMFTRAMLVALRGSGKVSGVVLANNASSSRPAQYSPEDSCPNRYSGMSSLETQTCNPDKPWNPVGSALLQEDWGFPMYHVDDADTLDKIQECYTKHNADRHDTQESRPLCALEMQAFMYAAVDSRTCIRRNNIVTYLHPTRYCDALGDSNIIATLFPRPHDSTQRNNQSVIVLSARLDATSMFDGLVPGAVSPTTGIVALLVTAHMLAAMLPADQAATASANVMFALLNGEAYDYIGSSRMSYDMSRDMFPAAYDAALGEQPAALRLADVQLFLELSQLSAVRPLHLHRSDLAGFKAQEFIREVIAVGQEHNLVFEENNNIPPSSLQTFLKEDAELPGVILADHGDQYVNNYYHSILDNTASLGYSYANGGVVSPSSLQAMIGNLSATLAKTLYKMTTQREYTGQHATPNLTLVDELFHCHLESTNCSLFRAVTSHDQALPADKPAQHYVGVSVNANLVPALTGMALAFLTGDKTDLPANACSDSNTTLYKYYWMSAYSSGEGNDTGVCVKTTLTFTPAVSPAFIIDDYDWLSGNYSTWTESIWNQLSVRMFLKPSRAQETVTFCLGAIVMIVSFLVVYFVSTKSDQLFASNTPLAAAC